MAQSKAQLLGARPHSRAIRRHVAQDALLSVRDRWRDDEKGRRVRCIPHDRADRVSLLCQAHLRDAAIVLRAWDVESAMLSECGHVEGPEFELCSSYHPHHDTLQWPV
eukprot:5107952-Prymnesium_polylepis.1